MKNDIVLTHRQAQATKFYLGEKSFYGQIKVSNLLYVINGENTKNFIELADYLKNIENINLADYVLIELQEKEELFNKNIIYFLDYTIEHSTLKKEDVKDIINKSITHFNTTSRADYEEYRMEDFKILTKLNTNPEDFTHILKFLKSINNLYELSYEETSLYRKYHDTLSDEVKKENKDLFDKILPNIYDGEFFKNTTLIDYITTVDLPKLANRYYLTSRETVDKLHEIHNEYLTSLNEHSSSKSLVQFNFLDREFRTNINDIEFKVTFRSQKEVDEFSAFFNQILPILVGRFDSNEELTQEYCIKLTNSLYLKSKLNSDIPVKNESHKKQKL